MIKVTQLDNEEREMIVVALGMRRNWIETGDVVLSAKDVEARKFSDHEIKALSTDQMRLIIRTEELIAKLYS